MTHKYRAEQPEALRFTKKPVTIVASQWFKSGDHPAVRDISDSDDLFFTGMGGAILVEREKFGVIGTLESPNHLVTPGDWIITGVKGEHYPCKPDIFEATYAPETKLQQGKCLRHIDEPQADALDAARLLYATKDFDGYVHVMRDKYDFALECMEEAGRSEPTIEDELNGVRRLIDAALAAQAKQGEKE